MFFTVECQLYTALGRFTYRKYVTDLYTGEKVERGVYKSSTFARDLNVSVGFGFPFYWEERLIENHRIEKEPGS